eukprot:441198-Pelagomonas_calceolata.AAC.8
MGVPGGWHKQNWFGQRLAPRPLGTCSCTQVNTRMLKTSDAITSKVSVRLLKSLLAHQQY